MILIEKIQDHPVLAVGVLVAAIGLVEIGFHTQQVRNEDFERVNKASPEQQFESVKNGSVYLSCKDELTGRHYIPKLPDLEAFISKRHEGCEFNLKL